MLRGTGEVEAKGHKRWAWEGCPSISDRGSEREIATSPPPPSPLK